MYLLYNKFGEVKIIYHQEPTDDVISNYEGCIYFEGVPNIDGYETKYRVDVNTKEVIVTQEYQNNILKEELAVLSDTLDFVLSGGDI